MGVAVVGLVVLVAATWVSAALWSLFRFVELAVVGIAAGWIGWRLGVWHGRRRE